ncbi:MAG TPA: adenosylcobinamide-GDP ribazoletransferase [Methylocella sp.]|nr:adenosylcobinamide-GDP ribazoletransferase [Methylocella sp.]
MRPGSSLLADFWFCLGFYTRLPVPRTAHGANPPSLARFSRAVRMLPLAGAVLGAFAALIMGVAAGLGLRPLLAALLAVGCLILLSGALHEDGLADCADGFFGGATRERKLEIMQDSRIGTFGAVALLLSLSLRGASLALIADESLALAATVLIAAAAFSRTVALLPLAILPPARSNGAGHAAGKPETAALAIAAFLAIIGGLAPILAGATPARALTAMALTTGAGAALVPLARRHIGGQTGDVAGAAQQLGEIAFYLAYAAQL